MGPGREGVVGTRADVQYPPEQHGRDPGGFASVASLAQADVGEWRESESGGDQTHKDKRKGRQEKGMHDP